MRDTPPSAPENGAHEDPVMEQFVTVNEEQMQIPKTVGGVPGFIYRLFTNIERVMLNKK